MALRQPADEVEAALAEHVTSAILSPIVLEKVVAKIRAEVRAQAVAAERDTAPMEEDLKRLRQEQKRLAAAAALADDVDELAAEMRQRRERIRRLETDLAINKQAPKIRADLALRIEADALARLGDMRKALAEDPAGAREVFLALFSQGLSFRAEPSETGRGRAWRIEGPAKLGMSNSMSDPNGSLSELDLGFASVHARRAA